MWLSLLLVGKASLDSLVALIPHYLYLAYSEFFEASMKDRRANEQKTGLGRD